VVKNKFYCGMRKFIRKLNKFLREHSRRYKKEVKYESIMRILDANECFVELPEAVRGWNSSIRGRIVELTLKSIREQEFTEPEIDELTEDINRFNLHTRSYKTKRAKALEFDKGREPEPHNAHPELKLKMQVSDPATECELHKLEDASVESEARVGAAEILEDFWASLEVEEGHPAQPSKLSTDILDEMFPETFNQMNLGEML
jgi:hypothetical protein